MIRKKAVAFALFVVLFLLFWNLADYWYTVLTAGDYRFAVGGDLGIPLAAAAGIGYLLFLRKK